MKPGIPKWAENSVYASGVDAGFQNKYEPSSGRVEDGFERGKTLSAGWENMHRWRVTQRLDNLAAARLKNWEVMTDQAAAPLTFGAAASIISAGCYRPIAPGLNADFHHIQVNDVGTTNSTVSSSGGRYWVSAASTVVSVYDIKSDESGLAGFAVGSLNPYGLYYSNPATPLTLAVSPTSIGKGFCSIDHYHGFGGGWMAVEYVTGNIWAGASLSAGLSIVSAIATASSTGTVRTSNHESGTLYPQDAGNLAHLYCNNAGTWARSTDAGAGTWGAITPAPFAPQITYRNALAYSAWGSRWGVICDNGPLSTLPTFAYSDDNGDNWVEVQDAFGWDAGGHGAFGGQEAVLLCDGFGHWVAAAEVNNGGSYYVDVHASVDNGETWFQVHLPWDRTSSSTTARTQITGWYGDGAFWLAHMGYNGSASVLEIAKTISTGEF